MMMTSVGFIEKTNQNLKFVVIVSKYKNKFIIVKHKSRDTWEIPGGHIEHQEKPLDAAARELYEETGAKEFKLIRVCAYWVCQDLDKTYGELYYAEVNELGKLPKFEISEIKTVTALPSKLTYPEIQPKLFDKIIDFLKKTTTNNQHN